MTLMIAEPSTSGMSLGVGFEGGRYRPRNEAWRTAIGTKPVPARFDLLPEGEKRWDRIGVSAILQISLLIFFVALPVFFPERLSALKYSVVPLTMPVTEIPVAPPPPPPPKVRAKAPEPKPIELPKLSPKQPHIFVQQKAFQPQIKQLEVKAPELVKTNVFEEAKLNTPINGPKRPHDDVKMNNLGTGSAAPATVKAPVEKVQTGGFGEPNGLAGKGNPNKTTNINRLGSPALPGGDGYGNGTGGAKGIRGTVASTGFGNGVANPPVSGGGKRGTVQSGGFADASVADNTPKKKALASESPTTMVDILDKPRPQYTAEGRSLRLEGDVLLDLVFQADGTIQVNRVISGLGHGLDEAAVRAAQQMKFKPAKRDGQPVDFPARVRIEFRLAY
ncbi:MAG TPA: TonB family protein [Candidatus Saccharimonadales bacterium]|nr:TonB family protein [Candidatus Saccharimonadales bacterium]